MTTICRATRSDGQPCKSWQHLSDDGYCLAHDPLRADQVRAARARGTASHKRTRGRGLATVPAEQLPGELKTLEDCNTWAAWVARQVLTGEISPQIAREAILAIKEKRTTLQFLAGVERRTKDLREQINKLRREG
jgi:hypothetical protein